MTTVFRGFKLHPCSVVEAWLWHSLKQLHSLCRYDVIHEYKALYIIYVYIRYAARIKNRMQ